MVIKHMGRMHLKLIIHTGFFKQKLQDRFFLSNRVSKEECRCYWFMIELFYGLH